MMVQQSRGVKLNVAAARGEARVGSRGVRKAKALAKALDLASGA